MRTLSLVFALIALACAGKQEAAPEKSYPMTATIVSRDANRNTINLDHAQVPGVMEAMRMEYELRGAKVASLPPDGTPVDTTLHEQDGRFWVTGVKPKK